MFVISLINIILTIQLINKIGLIGAAIATAISIIIGPGIIMNIYYYRNVGLNIPYFWKQICPILIMDIVMVGVGILLTRIQIDNAWISFILHGVIYVALYALVSYTFVMNQFEKNQIQTLLKKKGRK